MMSALRLVLAQLNMTVGDIAGNARQIEAGLNEARALGADIVAFPELALTGYPPEDLLLKPDFVRAARDALEALRPATKGLIAIVGLPYADADLYNAAAVLQNGELVGVYHKHLLPNYSVFDEERYFQSGGACPVFGLGDARFGVSICEDIWYPGGPHELQARQGGAQLLINISASPYRLGYGLERERMIARRAADNKAFVAYCNLVGGQDELVFDGHSVVCNPEGETIVRGPQFETAMIAVDLDIRQGQRSHDPGPRQEVQKTIDSDELVIVELAASAEKPAREPVQALVAQPLKRAAEVYNALVLGTRDYARKNGFTKVVLGLSGGVDSSLTAAIAAEAIGPDNVVGVSMPSRYSSQHSLDDAARLADNLGIEYRVIPIDGTYQAFLEMLSEPFEGLEADTAEENIQARIRGSLLMALSNKFGWLVLTTSNKSEVAVGYSTLYGDSAGGFAVIKDVPKLLVYELCQHINDRAGQSVIPNRVLRKAPSAELRPNQKDSDSLPEYAIIDPIMRAYMEENLTAEEIVQRGFGRADVEQVIRLIDGSEFKRRQSPPGIKIMPRAFGKDWRLPITNAYRPYT
jgi:NAD+ synthase (glutamine-hydrolysing)